MQQVAGMLSQPRSAEELEAAAPAASPAEDDLTGGVLYVSGEESKEQATYRQRHWY